MALPTKALRPEVVGNSVSSDRGETLLESRTIACKVAEYDFEFVALERAALELATVSHG